MKIQLKYGVERSYANHNTIAYIAMIMKDRDDCMFHGYLTWILTSLYEHHVTQRPS